MKTFRILGLALFAIILCLSACSDGDNPIEPTPNPDNGKPEVSIDSSILSNGLSFTDGAGEKSISFIAKDNWTLSIASTRSGISWCTPSATSGPKGNANVKFTVTENTSYDDRSVSVTIKSGFAAETFTISQKGVDALLVTTDKYEVCQEGGIIDIEVKANIEYKMEISEASKDWIKESSSRSLTAYKHTLNIATNEGMEKREGEIHFKSGDKVETVKVYQAGGAILLLSQNEYNVSDKGDTISVDIKSNMEFGVQMPNVDWIVDEASARGLSSHTLNYIVAANEEYDSRSADIIFYDKNSDLKDTLKVVQAPKGALVITQKEYNVEAESEIINVKFNTNVNCNYVLLDSCDWIKAVDDKTRVLKEYELSFKIDENWSGAKRIAKIAIFDSMSSVSDTILINQNTIPDNEIWYRTNDDSAWNLSVGESFGNTYTNGKGVISYNTPITMIKDFFWSQSSEMKNTLVELVFPNSLEYIGSGAFGCTGLKKVTIPAGVKIIADNAFYECKDLKEIVFMNGLEEIKHSAFHSCSSLKNVTFPASFRELGDNAFSHCTSLAAMYVDEKNPYFSSLDGVLYDKEQTKLIRCPIPRKTIEIPQTVKTIGKQAFYECDHLNNIIIPNSVDEIEESAFSNCNNLKSIIIPSSVKTIGDSFVAYCEKLDDIIVDSNNPYYSSLDGVLYTKDYTSLLSCPMSKSNVSIPNSVTTIGNNAFNGCGNLAEIILPDNLETISDGAFQNCDSISNIIIPDKVTTIGNYAFNSCRKLEEIIVPDNVTIMGDHSFQYCVSLKSVKLSKNIKEIGTYTFHNCYNLTEFIIPEGVVTIGREAFAACYKLKNITIPNSLTTIGDTAFRKCLKLESITFPKNISYLGSMLFNGCESLSSIYCKATVPPYIDMFTFSFMKSEPKIYVPKQSLSAYKTAYNWDRYTNMLEGYDF